MKSDIDEFISSLAKDYDLPEDEVKPLINGIDEWIRDLKDRFKLDYEIDYNLQRKGREAVRDKRRIKIIARSVLWYINENWQLNDFKKYNIAGRILQYYKLDKYNRIKPEYEFNTEAQDYKHYLFDVMKSRFKTFSR